MHAKDVMAAFLSALVSSNQESFAVEKLQLCLSSPGFQAACFEGLLDHCHVTDPKGKVSRPLELAARRGYTAVVSQLLSLGASPALHSQAVTRNTPLHMAVLHGDSKMTTEMVAALQRHEGDVDVPNSNGDTALMFAMHRAAQNMHACKQPIERLLEAGACVATRNHSGLSALMIACTSSSVTLWKMIVDLTDSSTIIEALEDADIHGNTPLHLAARAGGPEVCENLLACGASPFAVNKTSESPLDVARDSGHAEAMHVLRCARLGAIEAAEEAAAKLIQEVLDEQEAAKAEIAQSFLPEPRDSNDTHTGSMHDDDACGAPHGHLYADLMLSTLRPPNPASPHSEIQPSSEIPDTCSYYVTTAPHPGLGRDEESSDRNSWTPVPAAPRMPPHDASRGAGSGSCHQTLTSSPRSSAMTYRTAADPSSSIKNQSQSQSQASLQAQVKLPGSGHMFSFQGPLQGTLAKLFRGKDPGTRDPTQRKRSPQVQSTVQEPRSKGDVHGEATQRSHASSEAGLARGGDATATAAKADADGRKADDARKADEMMHAADENCEHEGWQPFSSAPPERQNPTAGGPPSCVTASSHGRSAMYTETVITVPVDPRESSDLSSFTPTGEFDTPSMDSATACSHSETLTVPIDPAALRANAHEHLTEQPCTVAYDACMPRPSFRDAANACQGGEGVMASVAYDGSYSTTYEGSDHETVSTCEIDTGDRHRRMHAQDTLRPEAAVLNMHEALRVRALPAASSPMSAAAAAAVAATVATGSPMTHIGSTHGSGGFGAKHWGRMHGSGGLGAKHWGSMHGSGGVPHNMMRSCPDFSEATVAAIAAAAAKGKGSSGGFQGPPSEAGSVASSADTTPVATVQKHVTPHNPSSQGRNITPQQVAEVTPQRLPHICPDYGQPLPTPQATPAPAKGSNVAEVRSRYEFAAGKLHSEGSAPTGTPAVRNPIYPRSTPASAPQDGAPKPSSEGSRIRGSVVRNALQRFSTSTAYASPIRVVVGESATVSAAVCGSGTGSDVDPGVGTPKPQGFNSKSKSSETKSRTEGGLSVTPKAAREMTRAAGNACQQCMHAAHEHALIGEGCVAASKPASNADDPSRSPPNQMHVVHASVKKTPGGRMTKISTTRESCVSGVSVTNSVSAEADSGTRSHGEHDANHRHVYTRWRPLQSSTGASTCSTRNSKPVESMLWHKASGLQRKAAEQEADPTKGMRHAPRHQPEVHALPSKHTASSQPAKDAGSGLRCAGGAGSDARSAEPAAAAAAVAEAERPSSAAAYGAASEASLAAAAAAAIAAAGLEESPAAGSPYGPPLASWGPLVSSPAGNTASTLAGLPPPQIADITTARLDALTRLNPSSPCIVWDPTASCPGTPVSPHTSAHTGAPVPSTPGGPTASPCRPSPTLSSPMQQTVPRVNLRARYLTPVAHTPPPTQPSAHAATLDYSSTASPIPDGISPATPPPTGFGRAAPHALSALSTVDAALASHTSVSEALNSHNVGGSPSGGAHHACNVDGDRSVMHDTAAAEKLLQQLESVGSAASQESHAVHAVHAQHSAHSMSECTVPSFLKDASGRSNAPCDSGTNMHAEHAYHKQCEPSSSQKRKSGGLNIMHAAEAEGEASMLQPSRQSKNTVGSLGGSLAWQQRTGSTTATGATTGSGTRATTATNSTTNSRDASGTLPKPYADFDKPYPSDSTHQPKTLPAHAYPRTSTAPNHPATYPANPNAPQMPLVGTQKFSHLKHGTNAADSNIEGPPRYAQMYQSRVSRSQSEVQPLKANPSVDQNSIGSELSPSQSFFQSNSAAAIYRSAPPRSTSSRTTPMAPGVCGILFDTAPTASANTVSNTADLSFFPSQRNRDGVSVNGDSANPNASPIAPPSHFQITRRRTVDSVYRGALARSWGGDKSGVPRSPLSEGGMVEAYAARNACSGLGGAGDVRSALQQKRGSYDRAKVDLNSMWDQPSPLVSPRGGSSGVPSVATSVPAQSQGYSSHRSPRSSDGARRVSPEATARSGYTFDAALLLGKDPFLLSMAELEALEDYHYQQLEKISRAKIGKHRKMRQLQVQELRQSADFLGDLGAELSKKYSNR